MNPHLEKAEALIEALPYIQAFRGDTVVIKYGGAAMENDDLVVRVLRDIVFLEAVGINPVIVHGGGKAITRAMKEGGVQAEFIDGLRVSDAPSMEVIERTLSKEINPGIVERIETLGGKARGFNGRDILGARKRLHTHSETGKQVDLGFVGDVVSVNVEALQAEIDREVVPVVSPIAAGEDGHTYNINADVAAGEVARALNADKLIYLSDVNGVMLDPQDPDSTISTLRVSQIGELKRKGVIGGGMIPKTDSAVRALESGVGKVHFLDGRIAHSILLEIFTDAGVGTQIVSDGDAA